jgi:hypothetical protein
MPSPGRFATVREDVPAGTLIAVVGLCLAIGLVIVPWTLAIRRGRGAGTAAVESGLSYSAADPFSCTRVAFPLFRKGDGRSAENVMWREGAELASRAFDFSPGRRGPRAPHVPPLQLRDGAGRRQLA